jgi:serine/threonine protein kinase
MKAVPLPSGASPLRSSIPPDAADAAAELLKGNFIVYEFSKHDALGLVFDSMRIHAELPSSLRQRMSYQLCLAVRRLHSRSIVVQSLNPSQVWLAPDGTVKGTGRVAAPILRPPFSDALLPLATRI